MERSGRLLKASMSGLLVLAVFLLLSGAFLAGQYVPTLIGAHGSSEAMRNADFAGVVAKFHYWGSQVFAIWATLSLAAAMWVGAYRSPHLPSWWAFVLFWLNSFLFLITGNLLPMDRHAVQTTVIEASVASRVPFAGEIARHTLLQGETFSGQTLIAWYWVHRVALPLLLGLGVLFSVIALWRGTSNRPKLFAALFPSVAIFAFSQFMSLPAGPAALASDASAYLTEPNWYTWPLHGMLVMFDSIASGLGWIGSALIPALFVTFLVLLPLLARKLSEGAARLIFVLFLAVAGLAAVLFGGPIPNPMQRPVPPFEAPAVPGPKARANPDRSLALKGKELFVAEGCGGCHGIDGSPSDGAPDLTKNHTKGHSVEWYIKFIGTPSAVRPNSTMPAFPNLTVEQRRALAVYLRHPRDGTP